VVEEYLKLIIQQYYDKPRAKAEIGLYTAEFEAIYSILKDFESQIDVDRARGKSLDLIGKIVGISRIVENGIPKKYFGFSDNLEAFGFGSGTFFDITTDSGYSPTQLNDAQYRFFIKAKIAKNISSAVMISDDKNSIQDAVQYLFENKAYVVDNQDMTLTIYVDSNFDEDEIRFLRELNLLPKPQGVRYRVIVSYNVDNTFGFNNNSNAFGFGSGAFARLVI
jgi:hypothetical protein